MNHTETFTASATTMTTTDGDASTLDVEIATPHRYGLHDAWGDARLVRGSGIDVVLPGEVLVIDDVTPDVLSYLPGCAGVIIGSDGPWESIVPGVVHHDFQLSGVAALLRSMQIPHAWNVPDATDRIRTGDLVHLDPVNGTVWAIPVG